MSFTRLNDIAEYIIPRNRDIEKKKDTREFNEINAKTRKNLKPKAGGGRWVLAMEGRCYETADEVVKRHRQGFS